LNHVGAIDVQGMDITEQELMAHALRNAAAGGTLPEEYTVRYGSAFVNEYP